MRHNNNQYPWGGLFPISVPAAVRGVGKKLRDRMYKTVHPSVYEWENAVYHGDRPHDIDDFQGRWCRQ
jgi:hypothetical protein